MQKTEGVASVHVSLPEGLTVLDLMAGNAVTVEKLRQIIKNNGFVSKEIKVRAAGDATTLGGKPAFVVSGTGEPLPTAAAPQRNGDLWIFTVPAPR
jgi:hypothetical protein